MHAEVFPSGLTTGGTGRRSLPPEFQQHKKIGLPVSRKAVSV